MDESSVDFVMCDYVLEDGDLNDIGNIVARLRCGFCFFVFWPLGPNSRLDCCVRWIGRLPPFIELSLSQRCGRSIRRKLESINTMFNQASAVEK